MLKLQIIGRLGGDAVVRDNNGQVSISFSVAHTEKFKDAAGTQHERTTWVNCTRWVSANGSTAIAQYIKKGDNIFVEGFPSVNSYVDRQGVNQTQLNLRVSEIQLLGNKPTDGGQTPPDVQAADQNPQPPAPTQIPDSENPWKADGKPTETTGDPADDLPF